jgi:hypothetical protein
MSISGGKKRQITMKLRRKPETIAKQSIKDITTHYLYDCYTKGECDMEKRGKRVVGC